MAAQKAELAVRIGRNLKARRLELGLKQREVAARMDPRPPAGGQAISDWERAVQQPSERYLMPLVAALEWDDASNLYKPSASEAIASPIEVDAGSSLEQLLRALPTAAQVDELLRVLRELPEMLRPPDRPPEDD